MSATLKMIDEQYGGVEGYVRENCGLTARDIEQVRRNLISTDETPLH